MVVGIAAMAGTASAQRGPAPERDRNDERRGPPPWAQGRQEDRGPGPQAPAPEWGRGMQGGRPDVWQFMQGNPRVSEFIKQHPEIAEKFRDRMMQRGRMAQGMQGRGRGASGMQSRAFGGRMGMMGPPPFAQQGPQAPRECPRCHFQFDQAPQMRGPAPEAASRDRNEARDRPAGSRPDLRDRASRPDARRLQRPPAAAKGGDDFDKTRGCDKQAGGCNKQSGGCDKKAGGCEKAGGCKKSGESGASCEKATEPAKTDRAAPRRDKEEREERPRSRRV